MRLLSLGINHRTAPVEIRGRVAFPPDRLPDALQELVSLQGVEEAVILSTCNRTELYCGLQNADENTVQKWLCKYHGLCNETMDSYFYTLTEQSAVRHLLRVAAGMDSMILGEPQILGQLKNAYQDANRSGTVDTLLSRLFQHTFSIAKQIRTDTAIGQNPVSVAFAAVSLARQIFSDLNKHTALVIGAGETIELAARHLHDQDLGRMIVANRTVERAHNLAARFDGYGISLDEIPAHLAEADIVISSTGSPDIILSQKSVRKALRSRKHRPVFLVDIAVPVDIDPKVAKLDDVYLYTVDDLRDVIDENMKSRQEAANQAEELIDVQVERFMGWLRSLDAVSTIREYRDLAESIGAETLARARKQLAGGKDPEQVLGILAHTLVHKLIHEPSVNMRQAGFDGRKDLIRAARTLFNLNDD